MLSGKLLNRLSKFLRHHTGLVRAFRDRSGAGDNETSDYGVVSALSAARAATVLPAGGAANSVRPIVDGIVDKTTLATRCEVVTRCG